MLVKNKFSLVLFISLFLCLFASCNFGLRDYKVSFYSEGKLVNTQRVSKGGLVQEYLPEYDDEFATFLGWYSDSQFSNEWDFSTDTVKGNLSLYAKWDYVYVTVSFLDKDGDLVDSETVRYGTQVGRVPSGPVVDGYIFKGWFASFDDEPFDETWFAYGSYSVQAKYEKFVPKIIVYAFDDIVTINWNFGDSLPSDFIDYFFIPPGYALDGWYFDSDFTESFAPIDSVCEDVTIYAKSHSVPTCTITIEGLPYDCSYTVNQGTTVADSDFEDFLYSLSSLWEFQGWFTNEALTAAFVTPAEIEEDMTIYAKIVGASLKVTLMNCGAYPPTIDVRYNELIPVPEVTNPGYKVEGWYYDDALKQPVDFTKDKLTRTDLHIYANWVPDN